MDLVRGGWKVRHLSNLHLVALAFQKACDFDLFSRIEAGADTVPALAKLCGIRQEALDYLIPVLIQLELLECEDARLRLTPEARTYLVRGSSLCQLDVIEHHRLDENALDQWEQAFEPTPPAEQDEGDSWQRFRVLQAQARLCVPTVMRHLSVREQEAVLDLGAGAGTYVEEIALRCPDVRATLFEQPGLARLLRRKFGQRFTIREGDITEADWGGPFSLILFSQLVNYFDSEALQGLFRKAREHLLPGGRVVVHDILLPDEGGTWQALYSLRLLGQGPGKGHRLRDVQHLLRSCGLGVQQVWDLSPEPGHLLIASASEKL